MEIPFVTCEIGINHNGSLEIAKQLINMAVRCGCNAVKFQKRTVDKVYSQEFLDLPRESPWGTTQREQKNGLEFGRKEYNEIDEYCRKHGIDWYASAWDLDSLKFLSKYGLRYNKIASKMATNQEFAAAVAKEGKLTFISTGVDDLNQLDPVVGIFEKLDCPFILMHCVAKYPCPIEACHLERMYELAHRYSRPIGYSSHNPGVLDTSIAVSMGAIALEKHITLDRTMYGTDQPASLEERGLYLMVRDARNVGKML